MQGGMALSNAINNPPAPAKQLGAITWHLPNRDGATHGHENQYQQ